MKPRCYHKTPMLLVLALTVTLLLGLESTEAADQAVTGPVSSTTATPAPTAQERIPPCAADASPPGQSAAGVAEQGSTEVQPDEASDIRAMKQRYGQDPTGVRARLGMCRKGKGGPGGHRHRFRGGNQWNTQ